MNSQALIRATAIGTGLQVAMVVAGHLVPALREPGFAIGGMGFSAAAGWLYGRSARAGWGDNIIGGAIAGGASAFAGIGVSVLLGDVPASLLVLGTGASVAAGIIGAGLEKLRR
jgi:hypothetical protein